MLKLLRSLSQETLVFLVMLLATFFYGLFIFKIATFSEIVINAFSFIVFVEIATVIVEYTLGASHRVVLTTIVEGFIVFYLRDMFMIFSNESIEFAEKQDKIILAGSIIALLYLFRILSLVFSPKVFELYQSYLEKKFCKEPKKGE